MFRIYSLSIPIHDKPYQPEERLIQIACPLSETKVVPFCIVLTILIALLEMKLAFVFWAQDCYLDGLASKYQEEKN